MIDDAAKRLFGLLLAAYPQAFRDVYAEDMRRLFEERFDEARRRGEASRFIRRTAVDMIVNGCAERMSRAGAPPLAPSPTKGSPMSGWLQDFRYALRPLRRRPGSAIFVALTLGVGIGATTAAFTVVNGVLLRPLAFAAPEELVSVWGRFDPESGFDVAQFTLSGPEVLDYRQQSRALEDIAAFTVSSVTVGVDGSEPERALAGRTTANLFTLLGVQPALGRPFTEDEQRSQDPAVVMLSHGYWQSRFAADPAILGRRLRINGVSAEVVGVTPEGFAHPGPGTRMWLPLGLDPTNPGGRSSHSLRAIGRLADGVTLETARAELATLMHDWKVRYPEIHTGHYLFIRPAIEDAIGTIRPALLLLLAATGVVLLIVCGNVASIVLARGEARTREMAIRGALGAERRRLVRLSLIESALLGCVGGGLGLALAHLAVRALVAVDPDAVPRAWEIAIDARVVAFAAAASMVSALLFGLLPALRGSRADLQEALRDSSISTTDGAGRQVFRRSLIAAEVALSVTLTISAALMLRSFAELTAVDPGFRAAGLVSARLTLPLVDYREPARVEAFYAALLARLEATPGVRTASAGSTVPLLSGAGNWDFAVEGQPAPGPGQPAWNAKAVIVRPRYFEALGVPVVRGRDFTAQDDERAAPTVIINETFARKFFAGKDPVGRRIRIAGAKAPDPWMTIVGISADVRTETLDAVAPPAYHFLQSQLPRTNGNAARGLAVFARVDGDPAPVMQAIRAAVRALDPGLAMTDVQTMDAVVEASVARPRFLSWLLGSFAGIGLLLGASGIYGVLAYMVARRTREIGIRRALGAQPGSVVAHVVRGGLVPVGAGLAAGLVLSIWTTRLWSSQLFGVSPADPRTYASVSGAVLLVALCAMWIPVRRALGVSPMAALRADQG